MEKKFRENNILQLQEYYKTRSRFPLINQLFSVKWTFSLKKLITKELIWRNFWALSRFRLLFHTVVTKDLISRKNFLCFSTLWNNVWLQFYCHSFSQKFREITVFTNLQCKLISRNICCVTVYFWFSYCHKNFKSLLK